MDAVRCCARAGTLADAILRRAAAAAAARHGDTGRAHVGAAASLPPTVGDARGGGGSGGRREAAEQPDAHERAPAPEVEGLEDDHAISEGSSSTVVSDQTISEEEGEGGG
jgi:hypothetical protein